MPDRLALSLAMLLALSCRQPAADPPTPPLAADPERLAGQLFLIGFNGQHPSDPGVQEVRARLGTGQAAGVIVLGRNLPPRDDPQYDQRVLALTQALGEGLSPPPIIAVDQEGGEVQRLRGTATRLASFAKLGANPNLAQARAETFRAGLAAARDLRRFGFTLNFSPVLDVYRRRHGAPDTMLALDKRSFGGDPGRTGLLGMEIIWGHLTGGVTPCAKHFPGHGVTDLDSHTTLPRVDVPLPVLLNFDLAPYRRAIAAGVPAIMISHVLLTALDNEHPSSLSPAVIQELLRWRLGFRGVTISDDMTMDAIRNLPQGNDRAAVDALKAGEDLLVYAWRPEDFPAAFRAVRDALARGELTEARLRRSAERVLKLRQGD